MSERTGQAEARIRIAQQFGIFHYRKGNTLSWKVAYCAVAIVGARDGSTEDFAKGISRSVDTVEDLAGGARTYLTLWRQFHDAGEPEACQRIRDWREVLSYSHFNVVGELSRKFGLPPLEQFSILDTAAEEGTSVRKIREMVESQHRAEADAPYNPRDPMLGVDRWKAMVHGAIHQGAAERVDACWGIFTERRLPDNARLVLIEPELAEPGEIVEIVRKR